MGYFLAIGIPHVSKVIGIVSAGNEEALMSQILTISDILSTRLEQAARERGFASKEMGDDSNCYRPFPHQNALRTERRA